METNTKTAAKYTLSHIALVDNVAHDGVDLRFDPSWIPALKASVAAGSTEVPEILADIIEMALYEAEDGLRGIIFHAGDERVNLPIYTLPENL